MGGMDRKGVLATGSADDIKKGVEDALANKAGSIYPGRRLHPAGGRRSEKHFWENAKTAISTAHEYNKEVSG